MFMTVLFSVSLYTWFAQHFHSYCMSVLQLMPPAQPHQSVYKTLAMKNVGDSSVLYHFQPDPQGLVGIDRP